jgi:uncharacterized DUF497 family protein
MIRFEWDLAKARSNLRKHGVAFEDAILIFEDPHMLLDQDRSVGGELRWRALGMAAKMVLIVVAHTIREVGGVEIIRLISARRATPREQEQYAEAGSKESFQ